MPGVALPIGSGGVGRALAFALLALGAEEIRRVARDAETMSYDQIRSWALFCTATFDMARSPMVDVVDSAGLVRSLAIHTRAGRGDGVAARF